MEFRVESKVAAAVDAATDCLEQGDVVMIPAGMLVVRPSLPLSSLAVSRHESGEDLSGRVYELLHGGILVSQTCELVRASLKHPFATIAPIVHLIPPDRKLAEDWRMTRYIPLPTKEVGMFGDLSLSFPIEKSVLLDVKVVKNGLSDDDKRILGNHIGKFFGRPALPDDVVEATRGLGKLFRRNGADNPEGLGRDAVWMVRMTPMGTWSDDPLRFHVLFCVQTERDLSTVSEQGWRDAVHGWVESIEVTNRIGGVTGEVVSLERLSAAEWLHSDEYDLTS